ncbi:RagB/SusD family nutrient uptake outer membrane protein [Bacteroides sp. 51]|uniref:RagB/SusD family nutrient uptake outer membrane protein n=1 Tax=Bacteroides sp. 51 TaxID=2302938 RepID=UPI0019402178|nr:RagB/SusD family nutrient uptake outer membrane protein [Bacteroides sp. 51]
MQQTSTHVCSKRKSVFAANANKVPEWSRKGRQTPTSGELTSKVGQWIPNVSVLYQNGEYVAPKFKTNDNTAHCNFFASLNKTVSGAINADGSQNSYRDVTMARVAETYLVRAECYARQGDYGKAMADIN